MQYDKILFTNDIPDEELKSILNDRLPSAIRRSGVIISDAYNYQIISIKRFDEERIDGPVTFICIEVLIDNIGKTHKYYFRVYPNIKEKGNVQDQLH